MTSLQNIVKLSGDFIAIAAYVHVICKVHNILQCYSAAARELFTFFDTILERFLSDTSSGADDLVSLVLLPCVSSLHCFRLFQASAAFTSKT